MKPLISQTSLAETDCVMLSRRQVTDTMRDQMRMTCLLLLPAVSQDSRPQIEFNDVDHVSFHNCNTLL